MIAVYLSNNQGSSDAGFDLDLMYSGTSANQEVPGSVTGLSATVTSNSMTVTWTKPACDGSSFITSYSLSTSPAVTVAPVTVTNPFQTTYSTTITGLSPCTTYSTTVRAVNAAGQSVAQSVSVKTSSGTGTACTLRRRRSTMNGL